MSTAHADLDRPTRPASVAPYRRRPAATASTEWLLAHPRVQRVPGLLGEQGPVMLLTAAIVGWILLFGTLLVWRHDRFATFDHDLGIWDQAVWLLARGQSLITVRGLNVFGFHASPALYLFAPFSWLGGGVNMLNLTMVVVWAAGAIAVFRIGRHHLANEWHALILALALLVNFAGQWMMWETFHPEVIAITPLLFAYLAAVEGRWRAYAVWLALALLWKEDVALTAAMLGLLLAWRGRRVVGGWTAARAGRPKPAGPAGTRRAGILTLVAAVAWFLVATRLLIPMSSSGGNFTEALFGDLGSSPVEIARTALTQPSLVGQHLGQSQPQGIVRELTGSFGFVALLSPAALLLGLPQLLINSLAIYDFFWTARVHYAALPLFATAVAAVEGVARFHRPGFRRTLVGAVAVGAFFTAVSWGISPLSPQFHEGYWPLAPDNRTQMLRDEAVALPGPDDRVSAVFYLVPHLTHRAGAYTFPNPWMPSNWGVNGENLPDPSTVDWLMVDPGAVAEHERPLLAAVLADPDQRLDPKNPPVLEGMFIPEEASSLVNRAKWDIVSDHPDLLILRRVR